MFVAFSKTLRIFTFLTFESTAKLTKLIVFSDVLIFFPRTFLVTIIGSPSNASLGNLFISYFLLERNGLRRPPVILLVDRFPNEALTGDEITVTRKVRGKNIKTSLKTIDFVNLAMDTKVKKVKIIRVLKNTTNNDYERRGVISKGAVLEIEEGKCRVVSRPGQHGVVNAISIK